MPKLLNKFLVLILFLGLSEEPVLAGCPTDLLMVEGNSITEFTLLERAVTFLEVLDARTPPESKPRLRSAIQGDVVSRDAFGKGAVAFELLDFVVERMAARTTLSEIRDFETEIQKSGDTENARRVLETLKSYLRLIGVQHSEVKRKKEPLLQITPIANGHPLEHLAHQAAALGGFRMVIDPNLKRIGYLLPHERLLNVGVQTLFLAQPKNSVVFQHEFTHLVVMHSAEYFSPFSAQVRSNMASIDVPGYRRFFHLSEFPASVAGSHAGLVNMLNYGGSTNPPRVSFQSVADETWTQLDYSRHSMHQVVELVASVSVSIERMGNLKLAVGAEGIGFNFDLEEEVAASIRYAFNRGYINLKSLSFSPGGVLTFSGENENYDVPLPIKYREHLVGVVQRYRRGETSLTEVEQEVKGLLATYNRMLVLTIGRTFGTPSLTKAFGQRDATVRILATQFQEIAENPDSFIENYASFGEAQKEYVALLDSCLDVYAWPEPSDW